MKEIDIALIYGEDTSLFSLHMSIATFVESIELEGETKVRRIHTFTNGKLFPDLTDFLPNTEFVPIDNIHDTITKENVGIVLVAPALQHINLIDDNLAIDAEMQNETARAYLATIEAVREGKECHFMMFLPPELGMTPLSDNKDIYIRDLALGRAMTKPVDESDDAEEVPGYEAAAAENAEYVTAEEAALEELA